MSYNSRMGVAILLALSIFACTGSALNDDGFLEFQNIDAAQIEALSTRSLLQDDLTGSYAAAPPTYYYAEAAGYGYSYGYSYGYDAGYAPTYYYYAPPALYGSYPAAPTYYYYSAPPTVSPGGYAPAPTYYYTVPTPVAPGEYAPAPTYYYTPSPTTTPPTYAPPTVTPTYYYAAPPAVGYPAAPAYYYTVPSPGSYPTVTPTYYYAAPPAYGYPTVTPTYYYAAPGGYPTTTPTYYYAPPTVAPGGYAPSAPTYYYSPGAYVPTYYYTAPTLTPGYGSYAPTYYYYSAPAPVSPTECPACPVCAADSAPGRRLTAQAITPAALPSKPASAGTCYCPYDLEWKSWAISLKSCRDSLYTRCDSDSRLDCKWLDEYFNPGSASGFMKAHEKDISEYLYQDCPPTTPCSCSSLKFDRNDEGSAVYSCCRDLAIWAQVPHSGISQKEVDAFCKAGKSDKVAAWVRHSLWHEQCEEPRAVYFATRAIESKVVEDVEEVAAVSEPTAAKSVVSEPVQSEISSEEPRIQYVRAAPEAASTVAAPVLVAAIVGLCAFVAVLGGVLGFHYARNAQQL